MKNVCRICHYDFNLIVIIFLVEDDFDLDHMFVATYDNNTDTAMDWDVKYSSEFEACAVTNDQVFYLINPNDSSETVEN